MTHPEFNSEISRSEAEVDLLRTLIGTDDRLYPWEPTAPEAEIFFSDLESVSSHLVADNADTIARSASFFAHLDTLWAAVEPSPEEVVLSAQPCPNLVAYLRTTPASRFLAYLPSAVLAGIGDCAFNLAQMEMSLADQLVQSVQVVLPQWAIEDLQVLSRPLAFNMRDQATHEALVFLNSVRPQDWSTLTSLEQARLSLAIAFYSLMGMRPPEE